MNKHIIYLTSLLALASCSDKEEFAPGEPDAPDCMGVYFDPGNGGDFIFVPGEDATVTLLMHRTNTAAAADVPIIGTADNTGVTFPASVHFDVGSADAEIVIDCGGLPVKQTTRIRVDVPQSYVSQYADVPFNYETTALVSQWESANSDGSPVTFYFTDTDYNYYNTLVKVNQAAYQPIECEMEVLPGAGLLRITDFMHTGVDMTLKLTPSPYSGYEGQYRVSPLSNYYLMSEAYESEAYGDDWYNAWYVYDDESDDYVEASLTDLDGNAGVLDYPMAYWYSNSYVHEYSYAVPKGEGRSYNSVSMGISGVPLTDVALPSYFYLYFRWDGDSSL